MLVFAADDGIGGAELWKSDGTPAGTVMVQDIAPGAANSNPAGLAVAGDLVFFGANSGDGQELWAAPIPSPAPARKYVYLPLVRR
jgi:ELWxxDGT repeat protein